jgi:hypothetical protein
MATSGTTTWSANRDTVIKGALRKLSVLSSGATPTAAQVTDASEALNAMLKTFQVDGMPLWAIKKHTFTVTSGTSSYDIGVGKTINTPMPLKIIQAYRNENIPVNIYTNYNYNQLPLANSSGTPVNLYYKPLSTYGQINLWPIPNDSTTEITIVYQRPFEDMASATDDFDFPTYWTEAFIYGLAWRLAPEFGIPIQDRGILAKEAEYFHAQAVFFGSEEGSLFIQPSEN